MSDTRVFDKLEKIDDKLASIDTRLAKYNAELEFHIARTNQIEDSLVPIVEHVQQVQGAGKLLSWVAIISGIVGAVSWIWSK